MKMGKKVLSVLTAAALTLTFTACGEGDKKEEQSSASEQSSVSEQVSESAAATSNLSGSIHAAGSSALKPLADIGAQMFMEKNPGVQITIDAGGSGKGLSLVSDGTVDIGNSDLFAEEKLDDEAKAKELVDHKVCIAPMAPVVNEKNKVDNLTTQQLTDIFTGKIKNWKEVGGEDKEIMLITRPSSSGTRATFKQYALGGEEETKGAIETDNSGELKQAIAQNENAIGYLALSYMLQPEGVKMVAIDDVKPSLDTVYSGDFKVWCYEHMYTKGEPQEPVKSFLDFMANDADLQKKVEENGYGVTSKLTDKAVKTHE